METQVETKQVNLTATEDVIRTKLDQLAEWYQERDAANAIIEAQIEAITRQFKPQIDAVRAEQAKFLDSMTPGIAQLEDEIKQMTIAAGMASPVGKDGKRKLSITAEALMTIFYNGRETWDADKLKGLALVFPAIMDCMKVGEPYASIQAKRSKKGEK